MANKNKLTEKERLEKEQAATRQAMHDEIIWALKLQKEIAEECGNYADVEKYEKQIKEEQEKKDGTWEKRIREKEKAAQEKIRQEELAQQEAALKEKRQQEELQRKKELALKLAEEQKKMEEELQKRKEQEAFDKLPQVNKITEYLDHFKVQSCYIVVCNWWLI